MFWLLVYWKMGGSGGFGGVLLFGVVLVWCGSDVLLSIRLLFLCLIMLVFMIVCFLLGWWGLGVEVGGVFVVVGVGGDGIGVGVGDVLVVVGICIICCLLLVG